MVTPGEELLAELLELKVPKIWSPSYVISGEDQFSNALVDEDWRPLRAAAMAAGSRAERRRNCMFEG